MMRPQQVVHGFFYSSIVFSSACSHSPDKAAASSSTFDGTDSDNITPKNLREGGATPKSVPVIVDERYCDPDYQGQNPGVDCDERTQDKLNDDGTITGGR